MGNYSLTGCPPNCRSTSILALSFRSQVSESSSSSSSVGGAKDGGESSGAVKDDKQQSDTS